MKKTYTNQEIANYYDLTEVHYKRGWDLDESLAMHYGYWDDGVTSFRASLLKMNEKIAEFAELQPDMKVLDAGCGVGGTSIFLAKNYQCHVTGIGLSQNQIETCKERANQVGVESSTSFHVADYCNTPFENESFDRIIFLESAVHAHDKIPLLSEAKRLLRPGGKVIFGEYLKTEKPFTRRDNKVFYKWINAWAMTDLNTQQEMVSSARKCGLNQISFRNITNYVQRSSSRMFYGSWLLAIMSFLYKLYNPKVSKFADKHYQSLFFQHIALKRGLWKYHFIKISN